MRKRLFVSPVCAFLGVVGMLGRRYGTWDVNMVSWWSWFLVVAGVFHLWLLVTVFRHVCAVEAVRYCFLLGFFWMRGLELRCVLDLG